MARTSPNLCRRIGTRASKVIDQLTATLPPGVVELDVERARLAATGDKLRCHLEGEYRRRSGVGFEGGAGVGLGVSDGVCAGVRVGTAVGAGVGLAGVAVGAGTVALGAGVACGTGVTDEIGVPGATKRLLVAAELNPDSVSLGVA